MRPYAAVVRYGSTFDGAPMGSADDSLGDVPNRPSPGLPRSTQIRDRERLLRLPWCLEGRVMAPDAKPGFWQTLPGVLTAFAGLLTAVGGLIAVLMQLGMIGQVGPQHTSSTPPVAAPSLAQSSRARVAVSGGLGSNPSGSPNPANWDQIRARWTPMSGPQRSTQASTVRYCISVGEGVRLDDTQDIPFEKMRKLTVVGTPPPALTPGGRANLRIDLVNGRTVTGTIDVGCDFIGYDDIGRFSYYPDRLRSIEFLWDG